MTQPSTILLVDDARSERVLLKHALLDGNRQLSILEAREPAEALSLYRRRNIDIAFLDIRLGHENGLDLLRRLTAIDPDAFVVMVSHHANQEFVVKALRLGASGFIVKPFSIAKVKRILAHHARRPLLAA